MRYMTQCSSKAQYPFPVRLPAGPVPTVQDEDRLIQILFPPPQPCVLLHDLYCVLLILFFTVNQLPSGTIIESKQRRYIKKREARGKMRLTNRHKDM